MELLGASFQLPVDAIVSRMLVHISRRKSSVNEMICQRETTAFRETNFFPPLVGRPWIAKLSGGFFLILIVIHSLSFLSGHFRDSIPLSQHLVNKLYKTSLYITGYYWSYFLL